MCTVSMIGDHFGEKFRRPEYFWLTNVTHPSQQEFDALKREVEEMKALLKRAKLYDEANGEPDCEMDEKVALLKRIAEVVGVDLTEVFGAGK